MQYTKEYIANAIQEMSKHYEITKENISKYGKHYKISMQPIRNTYGSLTNLKNELGYKVLRKEYTKNEVIEKLLSFHKKYETLSKELLAKDNYINPKVINRLWGNFKNMYLEIFPEILDENRFTSKSCMMALLTINKILREEPILEAKFEWLKNPDTNKHLRIDAYYTEHNIAVEFHGIQHYEFVKHFHQNIEVFEYKKNLDKIKKELIISHEIKYIEIPYHFNQEQIINLINKNL